MIIYIWNFKWNGKFYQCIRVGEEDNDTTPSPEKRIKTPQVEVKSRLVQEDKKTYKNIS